MKEAFGEFLSEATRNAESITSDVKRCEFKPTDSDKCILRLFSSRLYEVNGDMGQIIFQTNLQDEGQVGAMEGAGQAGVWLCKGGNRVL